MIKAMEEFDADMCVAGYVDGTGNTLPQMPQPQWAVCNGTEALRNILYQRPGWHCSVCARMFTRDMISRAGQFDEALFYEDLEIAPRHCMAAARVAMTEAPLYFYRTNPSSFMNTWHSRRLHSLAVVDRIASRCAVDSRLAAAARSRRFSAYCNIMGLAARNGDRATARSCWTVVKSLRGAVLSDPETRLKNKNRRAAGICRWRRLHAPDEMAWKVVTLDNEAFADACHRLQQAVEASGYRPDMVLSIVTGGLYVGNGMFAGTPHLSTILRRPTTSLKTRLARSIVAALPRACRTASALPKRKYSKGMSSRRRFPRCICLSTAVAGLAVCWWSMMPWTAAARSLPFLPPCGRCCRRRRCARR